MKRLIIKTKNKLRQVRHERVRARLIGSADRPRLSVFRGNRSLVLQLIDDAKAVTICAAKTGEVKGKKVEGRSGKVALAYLAGKLWRERAKEKGVKEAVFDRGGYKYHGRVQAAADGAREGGLKF